MKKIHNIFIKMFLLLALAIGWGGSAVMAQSNPVKSISATFNNSNGNTDWANVAITPNAQDVSGSDVTGVSIAVSSATTLKAPVSNITNDFLGPDQQTRDATGTYTFTITGLPAGSSFDKLTLPLKAVNSGGSNQGLGTFHVNVDVRVTDGSADLLTTTLTDRNLQTSTSGQVHENICAEASSPFVTNTGTLVVSFTISKGTTNPGCFIAFHGLNLSTTPVDVDCSFDPADGSAVSDLSTIKVSHEDSDIILIAPTDYNTWYPTQPALPIVLPRLTKQGAEDIIADSFTSSNGYEPYKITFSSEIPDGDYTLILPQGTLYRSDFLSGEVTPVSRMTVNYTLSTAYHVDPVNELTLSPATGTRVQESLSSVTITINPAGGETVKSATENGGSFDADNTPYLILSDAHSNQRGAYNAPAGAIMATGVEGTSVPGEYTISFNPVTTEGHYDLVIPQGAFYVGDVPVAQLTATYTVGDPTEWVTIKNARKANGFLSLSAAGLNASEQLTWGVSSAAGAGEYWAFVEDGSNGYRIINKAYGPDYYLGIESTNNQAMIRMYHRSEANDTNTHFDKVASTNANASGGFCILLHSNHNVGISDWGGSALKVWAASNENQHLGDQGSAFVITPVEDAALAACPPYNVYKVVIEGAEASATAAYTGDAVNLLGLSTIQNGRYIALKAASGVPEVGNFTVTPALPNPLMDSFSETAATPATLMLYTDAGTMGTNVTLNFVDSHGHPLTEGTVLYKYLGRPVVELSPEINSYNFGGDAYHSSFFTAGAGYTYGGSTFDNVNQTLTFTLTEIVPEWYTMKPNNGGYISSDYANAAGRMHVSNDNGRPTNYAGIWTFTDVQGVDGQNLVNAKYYNSRVLSVTGTDGSAVAMMDPAGSIRNDARYKFEIASNGFVQVQGESLYLGNHSMNLVVRGNTSDGSLNLNLTRVPNLGKAVTIVVKDAEGNVLPAGNVVYRSQREDIPTITALLKNGDVYNFGNVPFLTSLFDDSAVSSILNCSYDEEHATLTFVIEQIPAAEWTVVIGGDDNYEVVYNSAVSAHNGEQIILPVDLKAKALTVNAPADKFVWGPVIDKTAKTITFDIRDKATEFHTGLYQLMLKGDANITKVNDYITKFDENINTASNYLYLAPSIHKEDGAVFKYTGVPTYAEEPTTYIYIEDNGNGTVNISAAGGASFNNMAYSFDAANGEITFNAYGINGYTALDNQKAPKYEPREMPSFISGTGPTTYALTPISMTAYDSYRITFGGTYSAQTRVNYAKPTPTGIKNYGQGDLFIVDKGYTAFLSADFSGTDARCTNVEIVSSPTDILPGELRLTIDFPLREYTVKITGEAKNLTNDRVVYNGANYENDATVSIAGATIDPTSIKTNVTDRFVWGPVIDEDHRTITFDIRPLATDIVDGWYQIQLLKDSKIADVNYRISHNNGNINSVGSYIYVLPMYNNTNSVLGKYGGVPTYAGEASSYFHITRDGANIRIQSPDGRYADSDGAIENGQTEPKSISAWRFINGNQFQVARWTAPGYWGDAGSKTGMGTNAGNQGPIVATGSGYDQEHYITKVDPSTLYDVYKIDLAGTNQTVVRYVGLESKGNSLIYDGGYLFLTKESGIAASDFSFGRTMTVNSISVSPEKVITFNVTSATDGCSNMIIHRQHDVYDRIDAISDDLLPGEGFIKRGGGMVSQPYAATFTAAGYTANDRHMQNTSVFRVTQYVKPGESTECVLPFIKKKVIDDGAGHTKEYQRWYDYTTERCLPADVIGTTGSCDANHDKCSLTQYYKFDNGHCNFAVNGGTVSRVHNYIAKADITLPAGKKELYVAVDASEFQDHELNLGNNNMLEPSLNMRVIYHIVSGHEMAKQLTTSGDKWYEHQEYIVPNVKRGSDTYKNNADLIPLVMPWTNYWFYKTAGTVGVEQADDKLMPLVAENGNYNTLRSNLEFVIEGTATDGRPMSDYIEVGVFDGRPGNVGQAPFINSNHHIYYKVLGSGVTRVVPAGSQAVIKVYAKDGEQGDASPKYQLFKFTLTFHADTEPLAITDVIGNPASTRSVDYFVGQKMEEVASLTFQQKEVAFTKIKNRRNDDNEPRTYAFPIDFERTSYGYSPSYTFANYSITRQGWGIKYQPVALYERNIKHPTNTSMDIKDDYFFYIDAAETPGQVAAVKFDGNLCSGSRLYCYGWLGSGNKYNGDDDATGANVVLRLMGIRKETVDGVEKDVEYSLASYLPGQLTDVAYDSKGNTMRSLSYGRTPSMEPAIYMTENARQVGVWNSIGFAFTLGNEVFDRYEMRILNNCISTSGGDYSLDDFRVFIAPAKPTVEFNAPICFDHVPHMTVTLPREAIENSDVDAQGFAPVSYCFVDKKKYYDYFDANCTIDDSQGRHPGEPEYETTYREFTQTDYNNAFNNALMGNHTATDGALDSDGKPESVRSFWNMKAAYTDAAYDSYKDYNFGKIISGDSDYPTDGVYRQINGAMRNIVFSMPIRNSEGWEDNREYIIFFRHGHVTSNFETAGVNSYNITVQDCQSSNIFKMSPSLRVNSDLAELATDPPSACSGQVATISADMFGYGPINKVELPHMMYDWWIGYGKVNETDPVEAANVHNFAQLQYGGVYLLNALDNFRAFYPKANEVESSEPQSGEVDGLGHVDYTQADKDCILHFLEPNENGRVPLVIGSRIINIHMLERDAVEENGRKYIYCTIIPITPYVAYDGNDDVIFCPDPQQFKILIDQKAPHMFDGFTALHDDYPASMDNVPVRMGLHQLDAVRLDAKGNMGTYHLRVPLRGVELANTGKPCPIIKNRHKKHTAEESYNDYLTLVYTDDPLYADRMIVGVDELGNMDLLKVGRLQAYNARVGKTNASHTEIGFARDFHPREGYVYTLKVWFEENTDGIADTFVPCPGNLVFDLKVVPEYVQWTAAQGNTDWTNDRNWARADRDVLHADNATSTLVDKSNAAHPYAAYSDNATNYSGDARYKSGDDASAHVFTPMYFTNVLMHDADLRAPEMYTHTAPVAGTSFLGGLKAATATKFIEYDMLATPISQQGSFQGGDDGMTPLALTDRYGVYDKNYGCELFWTNVCNGITFEPGTMMYDAQHLQYNRVWVEYELSTNRWYTLASPLKNTYAGEWYSPEAGGRQLTPHFYPVTYNPALNDRFNPAYYQRSWDKAGQAWIYRMAGDDDTYVGFNQQSLNSGSVRVQKPVYLNWSYVYNDVAVDYSNGGFSVNAHYTDTDSDGHLLNATGGKVLVRLPKDDLSYDYYQSEAAAHYDETHPAGGDEQNPDPTQPGTVPGRDDYGNGDNDAGNNPDGSNADGSGNASGRNNANGSNNEYTPQQGNQSYYGDNTVLPGRSATVHPRLMSDDLNLSGGIIGQNIQNASATNPYYLVGNPFMAPMNMDSFFAQQTCTRKGNTESTFSGEKYWMLGGTQQDVYVKVAGQWISNSGHSDAGVVAPLQGFFVQMPTNANGQAILPDANAAVAGVQLSFNKDVQQPMTVIGTGNDGKPIFGYITGEDGQGQKTYGEKPALKSRRRSAELEQPAMFRITATNGSQLESTAVVYFHDKASAHYDAHEDAETLLDGNIASKVSTVFTSAPAHDDRSALSSGSGTSGDVAHQALQINTMPAGVTMIPVGVIAPKDDTRTTLRFTGLDALEAAMPETPHLYDADNGTLQVLDEGTTVSVTGTTAGRYFIVSGTTLPVIDDNDDDNDDYDGRIYDLRGIRVNSVQHGTVTISRSRKEYNK